MTERFIYQIATPDFRVIWIGGPLMLDGPEHCWLSHKYACPRIKVRLEYVTELSYEDYQKWREEELQAARERARRFGWRN